MKIIFLSRKNIDVFLECPHKFGKYVINDTFKNYVYTKDSIYKAKEFLTEIASYEMKENIKYDLIQYRTKYTNIHYSKKVISISDLDTEAEITRLNNLFSLFSSNIFIGYNIPVDISIAGTNIIYRSIVDFGLSDEDKNLIFVDFVDMSEKIYIKDKIKHWAHYYTPYSFLASSFGKDVKVILIDPDISDRIELKFTPQRFDDDYEQLCKLLAPIKTSYLFKNLNACYGCSDISQCFINKKEK